jgi:hypothetical protein
MYSRLINFHKKFNHCLVPHNYKDKQLTAWVGTQRQAYKKDKLLHGRVSKLNAIGFIWNTKK